MTQTKAQYDAIQEGFRAALKDAFAQGEGWTKTQLARLLSGTDDTLSEVYADALAFLDDMLPSHYYAGKASEHPSQLTVWFSSRQREIDARVY